MTLNGIIALILFFFTEFDSFAGLLMVENKPILSAEYRLHFWPQSTHPAARSVCDSLATCQTRLTGFLTFHLSPMTASS